MSFEVAGENQAVETAITAAKPGGRVILVGIPQEDRFFLNASTVRRKGLTIKMVRRMGQVYPRAIQMVDSGRIELEPLVTHRFPLERTPEAFALQAACADGVVKCLIEM